MNRHSPFPARRQMLVVDKFPLVRAAIASIIKSIAPHWDIHERSCFEKSAPEDIGKLDLLFLSIDDAVPNLNLLMALREDHPSLAVVALASAAHRTLSASVAQLGAKALICKTAGLEQTTDAIKAVLRGEAWFPNEPAVPAEIIGQAFTPPLAKVLLGIQRGQTNREIAEEIGRTEATVKSHLTSIYRMLGVSNRTQAALVSGKVLAAGRTSD